MKIYTIGFTQKSAEEFFTRLSSHNVQYLIDIRINPQGQLSGFARQEDLPYFLKHLANGCRYEYMPSMAPTKEIMHDYRNDHDWEKYCERFEALMDERQIPASLDLSMFENFVTCLLCSEATPEKCHRRLVAERLAKQWEGVEIIHL